MSNRVEIQRTTFVDEPNGEQTHGYRIYDEYESHYNNFMTPEFFTLPIGDVLEIVKEDGNSSELISCIREFETGVSLDGVWYDYAEIKEFL